MLVKGTGIIVASHDPSVLVSLIGLSSQIILHKFNSPAWLKYIQKANVALNVLTPEHMAHLRPSEAYIWSSKATDQASSKGTVKMKVAAGDGSWRGDEDGGVVKRHRSSKEQDAMLEQTPQHVQSPEKLLPQILFGLTKQQPEQITYKQIEAALITAGFDPFDNEDEYLWLIEEVERRDILVVDQLSSTEEIVADLEVEAEADAQEVKAILKRIYNDLAEEEEAHLLTAEEQRRLLEVIQLGKQAEMDLPNATNEFVASALQVQIQAAEEALELLLQRNRRLVASVALKYGRGSRHLEVEDLIQEGMIGLQTAISKFDLEQGTRLSTYGTYWIRQAVSRAIADQDRTIRLPVYMVETINGYRKARNSLEATLDRPPTDVEIAIELNLLSPNVAAAIQQFEEEGELPPENLRYQQEQALVQVDKIRQRAEMVMISLNQTATSADGTTEIGELIPCASTETPEEIVLRRNLAELVRELLGALTEREKRVIVARFGLDGDEPETLEEIGVKFSVTRERIRQIQAKAIRKLQHPMRARKIKSFWGERNDECHSDPLPETQPGTETSA